MPDPWTAPADDPAPRVVWLDRGPRSLGVAAVVRVLDTTLPFEVALLTVELAETQLHLGVAVVRSAHTDALDAAYDEAFAEFAGGFDGGVRPDPPDQPAEMVMALELGVRDDRGTPYRGTSRSAGGSGTEWRASWNFAPGVPADATELVVVLDDVPQVTLDVRR